jgi:hypothetical protein
LSIRGRTAQTDLASPRDCDDIKLGRLAADESLANRVRSGRKQP